MWKHVKELQWLRRRYTTTPPIMVATSKLEHTLIDDITSRMEIVTRMQKQAEKVFPVSSERSDLLARDVSAMIQLAQQALEHDESAAATRQKGLGQKCLHVYQLYALHSVHERLCFSSVDEGRLYLRGLFERLDKLDLLESSELRHGQVEKNLYAAKQVCDDILHIYSRITNH